MMMWPPTPRPGAAAAGFAPSVFDPRAASLQSHDAQQPLLPPIPPIQFAYRSQTDPAPPFPSPSATDVDDVPVPARTHRFGSPPASEHQTSDVADAPPAERLARTITAEQAGIRGDFDTMASQGTLYFQYDGDDLEDESTKKGGDAAAAGTQDGTHGTECEQEFIETPVHISQQRTAADDFASAEILSKLPRILIVRPRSDTVLQEHTLSLEDCAHPGDWLEYVRRRIPITDVRFHKETMYLSSQPMDFDDDTASGRSSNGTATAQILLLQLAPFCTVPFSRRLPYPTRHQPPSTCC
jgi:hypothetical protein